MNHRIKLAFLIFFILLPLFVGCKAEKPIKIGFVGTFTGRHYDLGVSGRNGAMLAVEEANKKGGLLGRRIELIIKDDKFDPEVALKVDKELIAEGVIAIVGHLTSEMSKAVLPFINEQRIVMISPTVASPIFDDIDDYLIRINNTLKKDAQALADYAFSNLNLRRVIILYDITNRAYAEEWFLNFKSEFERLGGKSIGIDFNPSENLSFADLAKRSLSANPHGIIIVANALDTANICQQLRKYHFYKPIISSQWGITIDLISYGGRAIENLIFSYGYTPDDNSPEYLSFKKNYALRFGREPDFAAFKSYEAVNVILSSIQVSDHLSDLKRAILQKKRFRGLQGYFEINEYGDIQNSISLFTIKDGHFVKLNYGK